MKTSYRNTGYVWNLSGIEKTMKQPLKRQNLKYMKNIGTKQLFIKQQQMIMW